MIPPSLRPPASAPAPAAPAPTPKNITPTSPISSSAPQDIFGGDLMGPSLMQEPASAVDVFGASAFDAKPADVLMPSGPSAKGDLSRRFTMMGPVGNANAPSGFGSSAGSMSSLFNDDRSADLEKAQGELKILEKRFDALAPGQEELRAKRAANEAELKEVTARKQELTLKLSQASATYEAEMAILAENQTFLERERQVVEAGQQDLMQAEHTLQARRLEKEQLMSAIQAVQAEIADCNRQLDEVLSLTKQYQDEINIMRPRFAELHTDLKKQTNLVEINRQVLTAAQLEYQQLKADLQRDEERLEAEKKR
ncbi:hypothetical protein HDU76_013467, partial [Blyttiomyces sp. JEL0837]